MDALLLRRCKFKASGKSRASVDLGCGCQWRCGAHSTSAALRRPPAARRQPARAELAQLVQPHGAAMLLHLLLLLMLHLAAGQPPPAPSEHTACDTCTDPAVQKAGWWHNVGLNCPSGGDEGECDICTAKNGNSPEVAAACTKTETEQDCCQMCTMWNAGRLPGGLTPGNTRQCTAWYFRREGSGGWCGLKDCAGPGACGPAASGDNMVSGPACGTKAVGWTFVSALLGVMALYIGGGMLYSWKVTGQRLRFPESLPQYAMWLNIAGLVTDGVAFTSSGGRHRGGTAPRRSGDRARQVDGGLKSRLVEEGGLDVDGAAAAGGGGGGSPKKEKHKSKKRKQDDAGSSRGSSRGSSKDSGTARGSGAVAAGTPADAERALEHGDAGATGQDRGGKQSASAGGGRWVHVPT